MKILGYKIRRRSDGLYLGKGGNKTWSKLGGVWSTLGYAIASLKFKNLSEHIIMNLEIVELSETKTYSTAYILDKLNDNR